MATEDEGDRVVLTVGEALDLRDAVAAEMAPGKYWGCVRTPMRTSSMRRTRRRRSGCTRTQGGSAEAFRELQEAYEAVKRG